MIDELEPYSTYKDSRLPSIGQMPRHWNVLAIRRFSRVFAGATPSRAVPAYWQNGSIPWLASGDVNLRRIRSARQFITKAGFANSSTKWIRPGSLVIALAGQGRTKGMVATVELEATCNQSLAVIEPHSQVADYRFVAYWLESQYLNLRSLVGNGLRDGLNLEHVRSIYTPLPPPDEQAGIVRFLDWTNARLERTIAAKRKVIMLLNEQKQAIIHRAVTRGLDSSVALKPSGIPWLGNIPKHWGVRKVGTVADLLVSNVDKLSNKRETIVRLCNYVDVYKNDKITEKLNFMVATATQDEIARFKVRIGDVVITKDSEEWDDIGVPSLVTYEADDLLCGYHLAILRPKSTLIRGEFLHRVLEDRFVATQMHIRAKGVTRYGLGQTAIRDVLLPLPPVDEQERIALQLSADIETFVNATNRLEVEISLLREFRTVLVADVVTGKLDVREASARLPAESPFETPEVDADLGEDLDSVDEEATA